MHSYELAGADIENLSIAIVFLSFKYLKAINLHEQKLTSSLDSPKKGSKMRLDSSATIYYNEVLKRLSGLFKNLYLSYSSERLLIREQVSQLCDLYVDYCSPENRLVNLGKDFPAMMSGRLAEAMLNIKLKQC